MGSTGMRMDLNRPRPEAVPGRTLARGRRTEPEGASARP
jgi:hypothetical protein